MGLQTNNDGQPVDIDRRMDEVKTEELQWLSGAPVDEWGKPSVEGLPPPDRTGKDVKDDDALYALCLSGGGIRSATFCLGAIQGLAAKGLLGRFDYLSTVSGGGYIGSWLSSWIMHTDRDKVIRELASPSPKEPEPDPVRKLRSYTNYLSPAWGLSTDFLALVSIFIRNLTLHWFALLPLLAAALLLPRLALAALGLSPLDPVNNFYVLALALALVTVAIAYIVADLPGEPPDQDPKDQFVSCCFLPLLFAAILLSWVCFREVKAMGILDWKTFAGCGAVIHLAALLLGINWRRWRELPPRNVGNPYLGATCVFLSGAAGGCLLYWATTFIADSLMLANPDAQYLREMDAMWTVPAARDSLTLSDSPAQHLREIYTTLSVPALLVVFWGGVTAYAGLASRSTSEEDREWWARSSGWWLGAGVAWILAFGLVIYAPRWLLDLPWLQQSLGPQTLGLGAALLSVLTAAAGYWSKNGAKLKKQAQGIVDATGMRLLDLAGFVSTIALLLAMSYAVSCGLDSAAPGSYDATAAKLGDVTLKKLNADAMASATKRVSGKNEKEQASENARIDSLPPMMAMSNRYSVVLGDAPALHLLFAFSALLVVGLTVSWLTGINTFSLHSMYGNRLARAYLGTPNQKRRPHWFTLFDPLDNPKLSALAGGKKPGQAQDGTATAQVGPEPPPEPGANDLTRKPRRLFHVINVALNLVKVSQDQLAWQQRKAMSFTMSPLRCGSASLGFAPTHCYGGPDGGVSLGRAMAISGAAASPNMGYHTSKLVAFIMTVLNVRLGWWMPNPQQKSSHLWPQREPRLGLAALLAEAGGGTTDKHDFVYLSDGGHFENLGLYEMVRRRCRRIVVIDASSDPDYGFEDLHGAIRKIRIDFGIPIVFEEALPTPASAKSTRRHIALARIEYADSPVGSLVYIKPVLRGDEPLDVERYAAANNAAGKAFPNQPTSDQFFDEAQFESYRALGRFIVDENFPAAGAWPALPPATHARRERKWRPLAANDGNARVMAPASADLAASPDSPPGGGGDWWSSMAAGVQSMSGTALLATAVTVGGIVGVAGTVGLKDGQTVALNSSALQINLGPKDVALLEKSLSQGVSPKEIGNLLDRVSRVIEMAAQLQLQDVRQSAALDTLSLSVDQLRKDAMSEDFLKILRRQLDDLNTLLKAKNTSQETSASLTEALVRIQTNLNQLNMDLSLASTADKMPLAGRLELIQKKLGQIETAVQETQPQRIRSKPQ